MEIYDDAIYFDRNGDNEWYIDLTKDLKDQPEVLQSILEIVN